MRSKIDVFQTVETPTHRWNKYNTNSYEQDKYDLYFKNRFKTKHGYEKYSLLTPLLEDMVLYNKYDMMRGNNNVVWKYRIPDKVRYDVLNEGALDAEGTDYLESVNPIYWYSNNNKYTLEFETNLTPITEISDEVYSFWNTGSHTYKGDIWMADSNIRYILVNGDFVFGFEYDGYNLPYSDDVEHSGYNDHPWVWDEFARQSNPSPYPHVEGRSLDIFVDWDSPALTREGSITYHTKTRYLFFDKWDNLNPDPFRPEWMVIQIASDLWTGWRTYVEPQSTVAYTNNPYSQTYITPVSTVLLTVENITFNDRPAKYGIAYNSVIENHYVVPVWNNTNPFSWTPTSGIEPTDNPYYLIAKHNPTNTYWQWSDNTGGIWREANVWSHNAFIVKYLFEEWVKTNTKPTGKKYINYMDKDDVEDSLVKISGALRRYKVCVWGHGPIETTTTETDGSRYSSVEKTIDYTNTPTYYTEEQTGWRYYDINEDFEYEWFIDENTSYVLCRVDNIVSGLHDLKVYKQIYSDGIVVSRVEVLTERWDRNYRDWLCRIVTIEDVNYYYAVAWDYGCFSALSTNLTNKTMYKNSVSDTRNTALNSETYAYNSVFNDNFEWYVQLKEPSQKMLRNSNVANNNLVNRYYQLPQWAYGNGETDCYVVPSSEIWTKWTTTEIDNSDDFNVKYGNFVMGDILDVEGAIAYKKILIDTIRYGFSYPTVSISTDTQPILTYITKDELNNIYQNIYTDKYYKPANTYTISKYDGSLYTITVNESDNYDYHVLGVASTSSCYSEIQEHWESGKIYYELTSYPTTEYHAEDADYIPIYLIRVMKHAANDFYILNKQLVPYDVYDIWEPIDPKEIQIVASVVPIWHVDKSKLVEHVYASVYNYDHNTPDRWLTIPQYYFKAGTMVPTVHWPQMLYEKKHYEDVEFLTEDEKIYSTFGYDDGPSILTHILPEEPPEYNEGEALYRYTETFKEFYTSGAKAGSIYVPVGTNPETELYLTGTSPSGIQYDESNLYGYTYQGTEEITIKNALKGIATSDSFGAYPKDGLSSDGFWYEYIGTDEIMVELTWDKTNLRSVPNYNLDINSNQDFTIGDVAGASFTVDIQGNIKDNIRYLGRKCKLYYDFKNQDNYIDFGTFTIDDVKFMNHQVSTITAYDNIKKFDALVYEYLTSDNVKPLYPMTAKTLFQLMCEYCEVPYYTSMDFLNSDKLCYGAFGDANLTARQVLSYIAELAGGYIVCDTAGFAVLKTHKPYNAIKGQVSQPYETDYENILPLITSWSGENPEVERKEYGLDEQSSQRMNIFPTELIDSAAFNNADAETFINYRYDLNAIYDFSDNPFVAFVSTQEEANNITNGILDQIAMLAPYEEARFYSGEIALKEIDMSYFGNKTYVRLLDYNADLFVPTTININESGITLQSKGQPKYSTKIVNSELAKQVDSLKMNVKEIKLTIPDALADTLDNHGQQISTIETDLGTVQTDLGAVQSDVSAVQESVSNLDTALETQKTETNTQFSNVQRRDDGQDDRLDALEAKDTAIDGEISNLKSKDTAIEGSISTLSSTVGTNTSNISSLQTTVNGLPTKSYVDNLNQVNSITHGWKLSIGEDEVSFYTDNGYLFISDGTTTWKLKLEVNA